MSRKKLVVAIAIMSLLFTVIAAIYLPQFYAYWQRKKMEKGAQDICEYLSSNLKTAKPVEYQIDTVDKYGEYVNVGILHLNVVTKLDEYQISTDTVDKIYAGVLPNIAGKLKKIDHWFKLVEIGFHPISECGVLLKNSILDTVITKPL